MTTDIRVRLGLSNQERDILRMVVQGYTQAEVGQFLGLSGTALVSRRVSGIYGELGVRSRSQMKALLRREVPDVFTEWELGVVRLYEEDLDRAD